MLQSSRLSLVALMCLLTSPLSHGDTQHSSPFVSQCPDQFYSIAVHQDAKLCQIFDDQLPASLVYHLKLPLSQAIDYYLQDNTLSVKSTVRQRTLISSENTNQRIVVSPDGKGSQIDILVISPRS